MHDMTWIEIGLLLLLVWGVWDVRRALGLRVLPSIPTRPKPTSQPRDNGVYRRFPGAIPPNRYCVVRWPDGLLFYNGCVGAAARKMYEHTHPGAGEEIEFWELGDRRGHKQG